MRMLVAAAFIVVSGGVAMADDQTATADSAALQSQSQPVVIQPAPVEDVTAQQSYYGFSGNCHHSGKSEDTAKLLMN